MNTLQLPTAPLVAKFRDPLFPHLYFEYHEVEGKVWVVEIPGEWKEGQFIPSLTSAKAQAYKIAEHCDTHARAYGFVQTYLRGLRRGLVEGKHYQLKG